MIRRRLFGFSLAALLIPAALAVAPAPARASPYPARCAADPAHPWYTPDQSFAVLLDGHPIRFVAVADTVAGWVELIPQARKRLADETRVERIHGRVEFVPMTPALRAALDFEGTRLWPFQPRLSIRDDHPWHDPYWSQRIRITFDGDPPPLLVQTADARAGWIEGYERGSHSWDTDRPLKRMHGNVRIIPHV